MFDKETGICGPTQYNSESGKIVDDLMKKKGFTQATLGDKLCGGKEVNNYSSVCSQISRLISGKPGIDKMNRKFIFKLFSWFGWSITETVENFVKPHLMREDRLATKNFSWANTLLSKGDECISTVETVSVDSRGNERIHRSKNMDLDDQTSLIVKFPELIGKESVGGPDKETNKKALLLVKEAVSYQQNKPLPPSVFSILMYFLDSKFGQIDNLIDQIKDLKKSSVKV